MNKEFYYSTSSKSLSMFYTIKALGHFFCDKSYIIKRDKLNEFLVLVTLNGRGYLHYRNKKYEIKPNYGFIIDCSEYQKYYTISKEDWEFIWIHFNGCQSKAYVQEILNTSGPVFLDTKNTIKNILFKLHNVLKDKNIKTDIISSKLVVDLLTNLILKSYENNIDLKYIPEIVSKSLDYFNSNYSKKIKLDILCKEYGISKSYFIKLFKKYTGFSPYEYLLKHRLNEAKTLLIHSELSINDISHMIGFDSVSHFIKYFSKHEQLTPLKYREKWR